MTGHVHGNGAPFCLPCAARVNADQRDPGNKQGSFVLNGIAPFWRSRHKGARGHWPRCRSAGLPA